MAIELAFLVLPFILDRKTRSALPRTIRTSLAVWLDAQPLVQGRIAVRAQLLNQYTKEALLFAGKHQLIAFEGSKLVPNLDYSDRVTASERASSLEVQECTSRATFVGRWLAESGGEATVFALLGVRP